MFRAIILAALFQSATLPPLPPGMEQNAATIRAALAETDWSISMMGHCAERSPDFEARYYNAAQRYYSLRREVTGLFGPRSDPELVLDESAPERCGNEDVRTYEREAAAALERAAGALRDQTSQMTGLWMGPFHLCADTVEQVHTDTDSVGQEGIVISFNPSMTESIRRETEARVGEAMTIRLDGVAVIDPIVREPINGGQIYIASGSGIPADSILQSVHRPC